MRAGYSKSTAERAPDWINSQGQEKLSSKFKPELRKYITSDWLVAQKIVQEILKEDEQKKEQLHEQEVRMEEDKKENSR